jgi:hypothetical protein
MDDFRQPARSCSIPFLDRRLVPFTAKANISALMGFSIRVSRG